MMACAAAGTERFGGNMPFAASKGSPFFYSADVGGVHVVSLSPYVPFGAGSEQMAWLEVREYCR